MIAGIGNDIVDMRRVRKMLLRRPHRLPLRLLTDAEQKEFAARKFAPAYLAGRIAAKEALAKALQNGLRAPMTWQRVSVLSDSRGAPNFYFDASMQNHLHSRGVSRCHLSLSHDGDYAAAVVIAAAES